jgi:hypothetical protein
MAFEQDGFLSADIAAQVTSIRKEYSEWFTLAETFNRIGQRVILLPREIQTEKSYADYRVCGMLYFTRALSAFQASILLAERGMVVEANTLVRSMIETVWVLASLAKDKDEQVVKLAAADFAERQASGNWYQNNPSVMAHVSDDNKKEMAEFLAELKKPTAVSLDKLNFGNMAAATKLLELFAIYRHLSHFYAHPSVSSVDVFVAKDAVGQPDGRIGWNEDYGLTHLREALQFACTCAIGALLAINEIIPTDNVAHEVTVAHAEYQKMVQPIADPSEPSVVS